MSGAVTEIICGIPPRGAYKSVRKKTSIIVSGSILLELPGIRFGAVSVYFFRMVTSYGVLMAADRIERVVGDLILYHIQDKAWGRVWDGTRDGVHEGVLEGVQDCIQDRIEKSVMGGVRDRVGGRAR